MLQTHSQGCRTELVLKALAAVLSDKRGGQAEREGGIGCGGGSGGGGDGGGGALCWNLSKANNHLVQKKSTISDGEINITLL